MGLHWIVTWTWRAFLIASTVAGAYIGASAFGLTPNGVSLPDLNGCPRGIGTTHGRWMDTLTHDGRTYFGVHSIGDSDGTVAAAQVGERYGHVRCRTADQIMPGYRPRSGDATYLEPGTPIHVLDGTDPTFRLVALRDGIPTVYEHRPPNATTGTELLAFDPARVRSVTFLSDDDGTTVLGELTDPDAVKAFVSDLQAGPVDHAASRSLPEDPRILVALKMRDQPPVLIIAYPAQRLSVDGLVLSEFLLKQLPQPT